MTQEEKSLLLKDLCARLPFGVICNYEGVMPLGAGRVKSYDKLTGIKLYSDHNVLKFGPHEAILGDSIKPYLRPLSSMTEEDKRYLMSLKYQPSALEWSEEDELNLSEALHHIRMYNLANKADKLDKWFKSLKDRYAWKPSDEQLKMLDRIIDVLDRTQLFGGRNALIELKHDLKKLKG